MAADDTQKDTAGKIPREERLAQALRQNLRRRKSQQSARKDLSESGDLTDSDPQNEHDER